MNYSINTDTFKARTNVMTSLETLKQYLHIDVSDDQELYEEIDKDIQLFKAQIDMLIRNWSCKTTNSNTSENYHFFGIPEDELRVLCDFPSHPIGFSLVEDFKNSLVDINGTAVGPITQSLFQEENLNFVNDVMNSHSLTAISNNEYVGCCERKTISTPSAKAISILAAMARMQSKRIITIAQKYHELEESAKQELETSDKEKEALRQEIENLHKQIETNHKTDAIQALEHETALKNKEKKIQALKKENDALKGIFSSEKDGIGNTINSLRNQIDVDFPEEDEIQRVASHKK